MLELKFLQNNPELVRSMLRKRHSEVDFDFFLEQDSLRKQGLQKLETLRAEKNLLSQQIGEKKRVGEDASEQMQCVVEINTQIEAIESEVEQYVNTVQEWLKGVPNCLHESVPEGESEVDNVVARIVGSVSPYPFPVKAHYELFPQAFGFEKAAKLTGSRFSFLRGAIARLERAIGQFCIDMQTVQHGHEEISPPYMVNAQTLFGTGQLPKFEEDLFKVTPFGYYLIPTAEVPVTNMFADSILEESELPLKFTALTPCFRAEAGSYGKDTKGLIRQHQFLKTEMVHFAHPDFSYEQLECMVSYAENLLQALELPYRVITLCGGDTGFSAAKTYDIEVWIPSQNTYREISSCSNCEDFQARRANIRYINKAGKKSFVHTLNGSGLPTGRTLVAIVENFQQEDGAIIIPKALRQYTGFDRIISEQ